MPFIMEPEVAAERFFAHMNRNSFSANFPRAFASFFRLTQFLPDWLYYPLIRRL
jgi:hypothetical protein